MEPIVAIADPILDERRDGNHDAVSTHDGATSSRGLTPKKATKPASFYMSLLALGMLSLITSWDATSLAIALPVSKCEWNSVQLREGILLKLPA